MSILTEFKAYHNISKSTYLKFYQTFIRIFSNYLAVTNKGKKLLTADEKIAKRMIESGNKGLYLNLGIEPHFTIPGNPEAKSIEAFWGYCIAPFEKSFSSWIGNKLENRPEVFKNMDNKTLVRKFGEKFPTWDEFCEGIYQNKIHIYRKTLLCQYP